MSASLTVTLVEAVSVSGEYNLKASYFSVGIAGCRGADRLGGARIGAVCELALHRASSSIGERLDAGRQINHRLLVVRYEARARSIKVHNKKYDGRYE